MQAHSTSPGNFLVAPPSWRLIAALAEKHAHGVMVMQANDAARVAAPRRRAWPIDALLVFFALPVSHRHTGHLWRARRNTAPLAWVAALPPSGGSSEA